MLSASSAWNCPKAQYKIGFAAIQKLSVVSLVGLYGPRSPCYSELLINNMECIGHKTLSRSKAVDIQLHVN